MDPIQEQLLLHVFVDESDTWQGKSLSTALVEAAKGHGLAGATVLRGVEGYGAHSCIHTTHLVDLSPNLPIIIEVFDTEAKVKAFLPVLDEMVREGLATSERVNVIFQGSRDDEAANQHRGDGE